METQTEVRRVGLDMIREYEIYHKDDPERKVRFRTVRTLTTKQVKEKMVNAGLFPESVVKELRVIRK